MLGYSLISRSPRVLQDSVKSCSRKVESSYGTLFQIAGVAAREASHDAERLSITLVAILESSLADKLIQLFFGNVAKRRMTKIMRESRCLGGVGIKAAQFLNYWLLVTIKILRKAPGDLANLQ